MPGVDNICVAKDYMTMRYYLHFKHPIYGFESKVELNAEQWHKLAEPEYVAYYMASAVYNEFPDIASVNAPVSPTNIKDLLPTTKAQSGIILFDEAKPPEWSKPEANPFTGIKEAMKQMQVSIQPMTTTFQTLVTEMSKYSEQMAKSYKLAFEKALLTGEFPPISVYIAHASKGAADYALAHPGMKAVTKCPAKRETYNYLEDRVIKTDEPCPRTDALDQTIVHLNDSHKWTREQIADWLDTLDEQPIFYPEIDEEIGV